MSEQLKTCPFCGSAAEYDSTQEYRGYFSGEIEKAVVVYCLECQASISICKKDVPDITIDDVKGMWNRRSIDSVAAQAAAWRSLVEWICTATTTVDAQARQMYALDLVQGTAFEDWYDEAAGVDTGTNAPPEAVLRVLRPYLLDKVQP